MADQTVGLMELINVYETTADDNQSNEVLDTIIDKVVEVEQCDQELAIEFAYLLKLARANDHKLPGEYTLKRILGFIRMSKGYERLRYRVNQQGKKEG